MTIELSQIAPCFEGVVPSKIATCSLAGVPNASYLSHVYYVDEKHIATSFMFFNKTRKNLFENPFACLQVRDPQSLQPYKLKVKYIRSEDSGPIFDKMNVKIDIIAAYEGMGAVFKLKAADIYEVLEIEKVSEKTSFKACDEVAAPCVEDLELLRVLSEKINGAESVEDLLDQTLLNCNKYLGWSNMVILFVDEYEKNLLTHASFGYDKEGAGSEVKWGEGLIGLSAKLNRMLQVGSLQEGARYARAVRTTSDDAMKLSSIPLPGLEKPASQIATPILAHGLVLGVFVVESQTKFYWEARESLILSVVASHLGLGVSSLVGKGVAISSDKEMVSRFESLSKVKYVEGEEILFVNDQYLIKNLPARILLYLLEVYRQTGRTDFSNIELRAEKSLMLPEIKDNLETRLILLRKRLKEQNLGFGLVSTGRGKFKLEVHGVIELEVCK